MRQVSKEYLIKLRTRGGEIILFHVGLYVIDFNHRTNLGLADLEIAALVSTCTCENFEQHPQI